MNFRALPGKGVKWENALRKASMQGSSVLVLLTAWPMMERLMTSMTSQT